VKSGVGVFCANFCSPREVFRACEKVWCVKCYTVPYGSPFPIREAKDEDGFVNAALGGDTRFKSARSGDFLMTAFQCDLCHFINIKRWCPVSTSQKDKFLLVLIRVASIDAFWSVEPSTVATNLSQARRMEAIGEECGMDSISPPLGPFLIENTFRMKAACVLLQRSLDSGKTERFIQFSTARKIGSTYSNVYHSSQELSRVTVMAHKLSKTYSTECPTYGYWFEKFILGWHKRMGDVGCSDFALSKPLFLELVDDLKDDSDDCQDEGERFKVAGFAMVLLSTFLCGLRGEEVMKSDIAGLLKYLDIGATDIFHPHVIIALLGRLKEEEVGEQYLPSMYVFDNRLSPVKDSRYIGDSPVVYGAQRCHGLGLLANFGID
jgi:hypothetical protein